jgi:ABC-type multidrug transport system fused ATPase/permease subunit
MALYADRIIVLDGGAVAEQGTHAELMERKGLYYTLYSKQLETAGGEAA